MQDVPIGDLFAVADALAAAVGGPVILEDPGFRVVAYSAFVGPMDRGRAEAILGRRIPSRWLEHLARTGSLDRLRATSDVIDVVDGPWDAHRRLITSVRDGQRQVGVVWVAEGDVPLGPDAAAVLREEVVAATPHFVRHHEVTEAEVARRARTVRALLAGERVPAGPLAELGLHADATFAVLAFAGPPEEEGARDDPAGRRLDHVQACAESLRWQCVAAPVGRTVQVVVVVPPGGPATGVGRLGREVVRSAPAATGPLRGAASTVATGAGALGRLRDEAVGALEVLAARPGHAPGEPFAAYDEVAAEVLVRDVVRSLPPTAGLAGLRVLQDHDARRGGSHVATLRAYLTAGGRVTEAAAALDVHVTTLRYRLGRIAELSGLQLDDPQVRLACDLLLRRDALDGALNREDRGRASGPLDGHRPSLGDGTRERGDDLDAPDPVEAGR